MSKFASSRLTAGQLNAIVKKLGGYEDALMFLRDKTPAREVSRNWMEHDGTIYLLVTSDGTSGPEWLRHFRDAGIKMAGRAKSVLISPDFSPTSGITSLIAVLKGNVFGDKKFDTRMIRAKAADYNWKEPNAEVACLIRKKISDEEIRAMKLFSLIVMHEPVDAPIDKHGDEPSCDERTLTDHEVEIIEKVLEKPFADLSPQEQVIRDIFDVPVEESDDSQLLSIIPFADGQRLASENGRLDYGEWCDDHGFAFVASQFTRQN